MYKKYAVPVLGAIGFGAAAYTYGGGAEATPVPAPKNAAFVFVKPHAVTNQVNGLVKSELEAKGIKILTEGELTSETIDKDKLIDQHYYAIASKATILKPEDMNVPADKFEGFFNKKWDTMLAEKKVFNALDACKQLGVSPGEMNTLWGSTKKNKKLIKFGGGFYCGEITAKGQTIYVFNGFFMEMRNTFTAPGKKIHYYSVEWDEKDLSWSDFRNKVLGPTDPKEAPKDSLRGKVLADWKKLGLASEPNVGDNGVHASASPFEGMAERMNWLGATCPKDAFCTALKASGLSEDTIKAWSVDPQVKIGEGKKKSLFDSLEDMDAGACVAEAKKLNALQA